MISMSTTHRLRVTVLLLLAVAAGSSSTRAQISPWARGAGMAGANMLLASGYQAIEWNPANLALPGAPRWSFGYSTFEANASVAGTTVTDLMDILSAEGIEIIGSGTGS